MSIASESPDEGLDLGGAAAIQETCTNAEPTIAPSLTAAASLGLIGVAMPMPT